MQQEKSLLVEHIQQCTETLPEAFFLVSRDGTVIAANQAASRLLGLDSAVFASGRRLADLTADSHERLIEYLRVCSGNRYPIPGRLRLRRSDGLIIDSRCSGIVVTPGGRTSSIILLRCDTASSAHNKFTALNDRLEELSTANRKLIAQSELLKEEVAGHALAEKELYTSHESLLTVLNSIDAIVYVSDMETYEILFINEYVRNVFGDITGRLCWKSLQNGQKGPCDFCTNSYLVDAAGNPKGVYHWEFRNTSNGHWYDIHDRAIHWIDNRIVRMEIATDVTDRRQAEENVRLMSAYNRSLIEASLDPLVTIRPDGKIADVNIATEQITGFSRNELIGTDFSDYFSEPEKARTGYAQAFQDGFVRDYPLDIRHRDGHLTSVLYNASVYRNEGGEVIGIFAAARDLTELKKLEEQLRQAQKMEAIGQLAGGLAHDFNNILSAIVGYGSLLQMKLTGDDPLKVYVGQILESVERASALTHSLLAFSRTQHMSLHPIDVNENISRIVKLLSVIIGEDIELSTMLAGKDMTVMADEGQIGQVLMNLAGNARDAMPRGGRLIISTEPVEMDDAFVHAHGYGRPGQYVVISVSDTGIGMDEKTIGKIFEPFFTTKEIGKGTGLGLAMVYGIVKQHNGYINVYSEPGQGTTFRIYLPRIEAEKAATSGAADSGISSKRGVETILLAEDDLRLRELFDIVLKEYGYNTIIAEDGEDAVARFKENKDKIDLVVMDVIMPKKSGKEACDEIRGISPAIKVLFMSGYTADRMDTEKIRERDFIIKPISPTDLLRKVREMLDKDEKEALHE